MRDLFDHITRFDPWAVEDDFIPEDNDEWYSTEEEDPDESLDEWLGVR